MVRLAKRVNVERKLGRELCALVLAEKSLSSPTHLHPFQRVA